MMLRPTFRYCAWQLLIGSSFVFLCGLSLLRAAEHAPLERLQIVPAEVELGAVGERIQLLVTGSDAAGRARDLTEVAELASSAPEIVRPLAGGAIEAVGEGQAVLRAQWQGQQAEIRVTVKSAEPQAPSFRHEIVPLLTQLGCNRGACHGKLAGQNGFRLSLRGYAPEQDFDSLVREYYGRRLNRLTPEESLLLRKATGRDAHGGGRVVRETSHAYGELLRWIRSGTPGLAPDEPLLSRLEILPGSRELPLGETQQLAVRAHFADGQARDVTWLCQFFSNDETVATVTPEGRVRSVRPGATAIRVHYQDHVEVVQFSTRYDQQCDPSLFAERRNVVDEHVFDKLASLNLPPSPACDDATFIRRAFLDTIGTLPNADEVRQFVANPAADKRERLIDDLLERPEFIDYWALQMSDLLQNRKERDHDVRGVKEVRRFHSWIRQQLAAERGWDEIARDVLTASGSTAQHPEVGYFVVTIGEFRQPEQSDVAAAVAQTFLGTRIGCARCHNHPLEKYTQDDYYHFAAYFAHVSFQRQESHRGATTLFACSDQERQERERLERLQEELRTLQASSAESDSDEQKAERARKQAELESQIEGLEKHLTELSERPPQVTQPRTGQALGPQPLDRTPAALVSATDPREALATWMTAPNNDYFSGNLVNRIWKHFMGVGLVEPVDDLRPSNPPSNQALWDALCRELVEHEYDPKHLMRLILRSRAYQLSSETLPENENDGRFYSHYYARRLPAEVMLDAISQSTAVPTPFAGYPVGLRAIQLPDPTVDSYFLRVFGRSERVTACACERNGDVTLPQLLHLQNSDELLQKIAHPEGYLSKLLAAHPDNQRVAEELFLATLARFPEEDERQLIPADLPAEERPALFRDLFWALLNSKNFAFNH